MTTASADAYDRTAVEGDEDYRIFYARYRSPVLGYLRIGFADTDVEAVAQETFFRALKHWPKVRQMKNPWPWLAVTARNLARNSLRDAQASHAAGLTLVDGTRTSPADPSDEVHAADQLRRLAKAMDVLTPLQRELLTVLIDEGLTGAQVARRLGMQPGAARMHLCRMRVRLTERFVALGGQLAVGPLVVLGVVRRVRRSLLNPCQLSLAATSAVLIGSVAVVVAINGGSSVTGPGRAALTVSIASLHPPHLASSERAMAPSRGTARPSVAGSHPSSLTAAPAVRYGVTVSRSPMSPGRTANADAQLRTPVGDLYVVVPVTMQSAGPGTHCSVASC